VNDVSGLFNEKMRDIENTQDFRPKKPQKSDGFGDQCVSGRIKLLFIFWN